MKPLLAALSVIVGLGTAAPGQAQSQAPPVFHGAVRLVTVDVTVVDKDGKPVRGLSPADFTAKIDGKVRPVETLDFLEFGVGGQGTAPGAGDDPATDTRPAPEGRGGRTFLLVFDDLSFAPGAGKGMQVTGERVLRELDLGDMVGVATTSGLATPLSPTRDRVAVASAITSLAGRNTETADPFYISLQEAIEVDRGFNRDLLAQVAARECQIVQLGNHCPDLVASHARRMARQAGNRLENQLNAVRHLIGVMSAAPAPRVVVFLSAGVALDAAPDLRQAMESVSDVAATAGVQLYALYDYGDDIDMRDPLGERTEARRRETAVLGGGLQIVAAAAGGSAFRVIGSADRLFARIVSETSAVYRLGIEVPATTAGDGPLRAEVSMGRSGVTVRTTSRALADAPPEAAPSREEALTRRLAQGGTVIGVPLSVSTRLRKHTAPGVQVVVDARLPPTVILPVTLAFALLDAQGAMVSSGRRELVAASAEEHRLLFPMPVAAGEYRFRFVAVDGAGLVGSVETPVSANLTRAGDFDLSDVLVAYAGFDGTESFSGSDDVPASARGLTATLELYPRGSVTPTPDTTVRFTVTEALGDEVLLELTTGPGVTGDRWAATVRLPLSSLGPGNYLLRATVRQSGEVIGTQSRLLRRAP